MEKKPDWNMEKLWRICEELQMWSICGESARWKIIGWKNQRRDTMEWYAKPTEGMEKCFGKL
jgi:hypothetical protein